MPKEDMSVLQLAEYLQELIDEVGDTLDALDTYQNGYLTLARELKDLLDKQTTT